MKIEKKNYTEDDQIELPKNPLERLRRLFTGVGRALGICVGKTANPTTIDNPEHLLKKAEFDELGEDIDGLDKDIDELIRLYWLANSEIKSLSKENEFIKSAYKQVKNELDRGLDQDTLAVIEEKFKLEDENNSLREEVETLRKNGMSVEKSILDEIERLKKENEGLRKLLK